ncbi:MAG: hypothetical protein KAT07_05105, partial [Calditrichia bacterium]|nr:hypothetical protein [Calditrichia bacterium]
RTIIDNKAGRITAGRRNTASIAAIIVKIIFNGKVIRKMPIFRPRMRNLKMMMPIKSKIKIPIISI